MYLKLTYFAKVKKLHNIMLQTPNRKAAEKVLPLMARPSIGGRGLVKAGSLRKKD